MPFQARPSILENGDAKNFANQNGAETEETFRLICWSQTGQERTKEKDVASLPEKGKKPKEQCPRPATVSTSS